MIKKLFILFLIFGFSLGQEHLNKTKINGIWECISCNDDVIYTWIFKEDNSGYLSFRNEYKDLQNNEIVWETVVDEKVVVDSSYGESGKMIIKENIFIPESNETVVLPTYMYHYKVFYGPPNNIVDMFKLDNVHRNYNGGDMLVLIDESTPGKITMVYER